METVFVLVKTEPGSLDRILKEMKDRKGVKEAFAVTGAYDILVKVEGDYITDALSVVVKELRKLKGVVSTETLITVKM